MKEMEDIEQLSCGHQNNLNLENRTSGVCPKQDNLICEEGKPVSIKKLEKIDPDTKPHKPNKPDKGVKE